MRSSVRESQHNEKDHLTHTHTHTLSANFCVFFFTATLKNEQGLQ